MKSSNRNCFVLAIATLILAAPVVPVSAQEACIDTDGDGWGWDGSQSCIVSQAQANTQATTCIDNDGDGYGWDGTATCLIGEQTQSPASQAGPQDEVPCVDTDGDGWGWDGVASCRVDESSNVQPLPAPVSGGSNGFNAETDLVALHFDHAPDRDDGHAAVAALMVRDRLGLKVNVVAGTYGEYSKGQYDAASEVVMNIAWGSEWLNAHRNFEGAVSTTVNRWASVMAAGGSIWVAEGGPSDFTSEVVRRIKQSHGEFVTTQRINVVQHSQWNEDHADRAKLAYTKANTRYIMIEDGNDPNSTADLRFESHNNGGFVTRALSSRYANEWGAAFNYLTPSYKLDFSDVVELLHIVGLGTNLIADVDDFGDYFF